MLKTVRIPRWCGVSEDQRELHIFVDDRATAAVAYIKGAGPQGVTVSLVCLKCKVAPMRQISVPRLELQAAVLCIRLAEMVKKASSVPITRTIYWTDATDVAGGMESTKQFDIHKRLVIPRIKSLLK